jgi:hypothetical protein
MLLPENTSDLQQQIAERTRNAHKSVTIVRAGVISALAIAPGVPVLLRLGLCLGLIALVRVLSLDDATELGFDLCGQFVTAIAFDTLDSLDYSTVGINDKF